MKPKHVLLILCLLGTHAPAQVPLAPSAHAFVDTVLQHLGEERERITSLYTQLTSAARTSGQQESAQRSLQRVLASLDSLESRFRMLREIADENSLFWQMDREMQSIEHHNLLVMREMMQALMVQQDKLQEAMEGLLNTRPPLPPESRPQKQLRELNEETRKRHQNRRLLHPR